MRPGFSSERSSVCFDAVQSALCICLIVFTQRVVCTLSERDAYSAADSRSFGTSSLKNIESYEITYPRWLDGDRGDHGREHPAELEVVVTAEGQELRLHLENNKQLLAPRYQEIWYSPSGARHTSSLPNAGHCFYHGEVRDVEGSSVAVNTCSGLKGLISLNTSVSYLIEPLPVTMDTQPHAVFRSENLVLANGSCPHHHGNEDQGDGLNNFIRRMMAPEIIRERRDLSQNMKYVELLLVADHAEFEKQGRDLEKTKMKLLEAANYVDKYYKALNIRVALIGLEVWSDQDKITVSDNPYSTLGAFLSWRRKQLATLPNDNAHLITGTSFQGTTIGLAPLKAMCSDYQSGGVNSDHSDAAVGVAATMAHEMGHNFGMSHDSAGCCKAKAEDGGCIMAAATGHPFPRVFNSCNERELQRYLSSGGGKCLYNLPNTRAMYGGQRCGNGYLEDGEECDCGDEEECTSPCCNANNCTLKAGAECAHGVCCQNCKLKSPGVLCRAPSGSCDLPEYCDGKAESCPANFYLADGAACAGGQAYCYTGMCLTLEQQCQALWGADGRPAPDLCFKRVNEAGDSFGNCGKDLLGKYRGCKDRDAKCGKIQCMSSASKPIETNAVPIDTTVLLGNRKILCRGTHVYRPGEPDDAQGDTLDPGLVMTGTKCGENSICFEGECRNASFLKADECKAKCHGHGLCNNNHNCHCDPGWAPPLCDKEGSGGSVDSGPVISQSNLLHVLLVLPLVVFVLLAAIGLWCCYKHKFHSLKSSVSAPAPICPVQGAVQNDAKLAHANGHVTDHAKGHANPTFLLKRQDSDRLAQSNPSPSPSCPARSRHSIVRPTVKPPPVPPTATCQRDRQTQDRVEPQASLKTQASPPQSQPPLRAPPAVKQREAHTQPPPPASLAPHRLPALTPKPTTAPSAPAKSRPEPPNRPPPPCPAKKPSPEQQQKQLQVTAEVLKMGKAALAPSAGQNKTNKS